MTNSDVQERGTTRRSKRSARSKRSYYPRSRSYLESAAMAREMDRL
jgi:hypothetical protein